ncbi:YIP1 family protein [Litoreibacter sp.]|nr:YIP1 family protein [Litoreibacter sp.]
MSTVAAILRSYRAPREVIITHRASGVDEATGLTWLFVACILIFVAELPELARLSHLEGGNVPVASLALPRFYGVVLLAPLMFLLIAAVSHLIAKLVGGRGTWLDARLALFWSLLAVTPLVLFQGLIAGFIGAGPALTIAATLVGSAFLFIWLNSLYALERPQKGTA